MVAIAGTYKLQSQDNFDGFLREQGKLHIRWKPYIRNQRCQT